jgi:hypothetical protein
MSDRSKIEWTGTTWNPLRGCTKISPSCKHCYAETLPRTGFVNSMSDLFQQDVPDQYIEDVVTVMVEAIWHTYQVLTKRSDRLFRLLSTRLRFASGQRHIWWGVSVEDRSTDCRGLNICAPRRPPSASCRSSRCSKTSVNLICRESTGQLSVERVVRRAADAPGVGEANPGAVPSTGRVFLFQTVGRRSEIEDRPHD